MKLVMPSCYSRCGPTQAYMHPLGWLLPLTQLHIQSSQTKDKEGLILVLLFKAGLLNKYVSSPYYVLGTFLSAGDTSVNKSEKSLCSLGAYILSGSREPTIRKAKKQSMQFIEGDACLGERNKWSRVREIQRNRWFNLRWSGEASLRK